MSMVREIKEITDHDDRIYHAAVMYAKEGIPILPVAKMAKMLPEGTGINYQSASSRPDTVRKWFGEGGKFRGFNIGIATGTESGVFALDIDAGEKNGYDAFNKFTEKHGDIDGPAAKTPSGGMHYLFKWIENARSSTSKIANGIDTRGGSATKCGGHIVVFPSVVEKGMYEWIQGGEVGDSPKWIIDSLGEGWDNTPAKGNQDIPDQIILIPQIIRMLNCVDTEQVEYEDWCRIGMAVKSQEAGPEGLSAWDNWSSRGSRYKRGECQARWGGFAGARGPVRAGTLFFFAKKGGWTPVPGDVLPQSGSNERVEEIVAEMNNKYAVISINGQAKVIWPSNKSKMTRNEKMNDRTPNYFISNRGDAEIFEANNKVTMLVGDKVREVPKFDIWMGHPARREYMKGIGCFPTGITPEGTFNIWGGFSVEPKDKPIEKFLWHIKHIMCNSDELIYEWVLDWIADLIQDPSNPKGCSIVMKGIEGSGKGFIARALCLLFGRHGIQITNPDHLFNKFNSLMEGCVLLFADEVVWGGNRVNANKLKGIVTEPTMQIEHKNVAIYTIKNMVHLMIASNEDWVIPAGPQSRRWLMLEASPTVANNKAYFDAMDNELESGGYEGILHFFLHRTITHNLSFAPVTRALKVQRSIEAMTHNTVAQWLVQRINMGNFSTPCLRASMDTPSSWPQFVSTAEFIEEFQEWELIKRTRYNTATNLFIQWLESVGFSRIRLGGIGTQRINALKVPPMDELKQLMTDVKGIYFDDDENVEEYDVQES